MARSFEEMNVWKESRDLVGMIYRLTGKRESRSERIPRSLLRG